MSVTVVKVNNRTGKVRKGVFLGIAPKDSQGKTMVRVKWAKPRHMGPREEHFGTLGNFTTVLM